MSNALWNILLSVSDVGSATNRLRMISVLSVASVFNNILLVVGTVVLFVWIFSQMRKSGNYRLRNVPLRRNNIYPASLVLFFVGWHLVSAAAGWLLMRCDLSELETVIVSGMIGQTVAIPAAIIFANHSFSRGVKRGIGLTLRHPLYDTVRGIVGFLAVFPVCVLLGAAVTWIFDQFNVKYTPHEMIQVLPQISMGWKIAVVISTAVLAPIIEEIFFRGLLQSALRRIVSPWVTIIITSVIFAAVHASSQPQYVPALFVLAVVLGYNYERCGRLWPSILMHTLFNATTLITQLLP